MEEFLKTTYNLSCKEAELFSNLFTYKTLKKGDYFLRNGTVGTTVGFVLKGMLKCVLNDGKKEIIDDFVFENSFIADYASFLTEKPSRKDLICLTDIELSIVRKQDLESLGKEYSFVEHIARINTEKLFLSTHQKLQNLRLLDAKERFSMLIKNRTELLQLVPQYEIASYLNVSPETLSRIRKEIF